MLDSWLLHVYKTPRLLYILVKHEQPLNTQFPKKVLHTKIAYSEFLKFTKQNFTEWTLKSVCQESTSQNGSWEPPHTSFPLNKQINTHSYRIICSKNAGAWVITYKFYHKFWLLKQYRVTVCFLFFGGTGQWFVIGHQRTKTSPEPDDFTTSPTVFLHREKLQRQGSLKIIKKKN